MPAASAKDAKMTTATVKGKDAVNESIDFEEKDVIKPVKGPPPVKQAIVKVSEEVKGKEAPTSKVVNQSDKKTDESAKKNPTETKPVEARPAEAKTAEAKPTETKPAEAKPAEAKPTEAKPSEAKPAEAKPSEAKPAEVKPSEATMTSKTIEAKPLEAKKVTETKPEVKSVI